MTLSIIIPVYNVESYIRQCIESVLAQTFTDFELLLVDDGSSDLSGAVCDEYAVMDSRIKVFHKENGGVSSARNFGLDKAAGKWVTFIDGDDTVSPSFVEGLMRPVNVYDDLDFVHGGCENWAEGKITGINQRYDDYLGSDMALLFNKFRGLAVSKLFKLEKVRDISMGISLRFDERMTIAEDMAFSLDYLMSVRKYAFVSETGYHYRNDNADSATKKHRIISYEENKHAFEHLYESTVRFVQENGLCYEECTYRYRQRAYGLLSMLDSLYHSGLSRQERMSVLTGDDLKSRFFLLETIGNDDRRYKQAAMLLNDEFARYDMINKISSYISKVKYYFKNVLDCHSNLLEKPVE